jgi:hypothetical protein
MVLSQSFSKPALTVLLLIGLPLLGVIVAGKPLAQYQEFPPVTRYVEHASFSWPVFILLAMVIFAVTGVLAFRFFGAAESGEKPRQPVRTFPWWGWLGVGVIALAWILAWTRFPWFEALQPFTFSPLWLGYILLINALTFRRTGQSLMLARPRYFLGLFVLSAGFWWYFEYLNRFVQNWYYLGVASFTPQEYVVYATLPFATVLPAVLSTIDWLATFTPLTRRLRHGWRMKIKHPKILAGIMLLLGGAVLMGLGEWPDVLFPFLWIAPLLIMISVQIWFGDKTIFSGIPHGDWRCVWLPAIAGLLCGFLWELWNSGSQAHWVYAVPYVQRFSIFAMPLLGYAGYLPFGLECVVAADLFLGTRNRTDPISQKV